MFFAIIKIITATRRGPSRRAYCTIRTNKESGNVRPRSLVLAAALGVVQNFSQSTTTMPFGPLSVSLAPYVQSSKTLLKWVQPLANWYANASRYRQYGFKYDDLCTSGSIAPVPIGSDGLVDM